MMRRRLILTCLAGIAVGWLGGVAAQSPVKTLKHVQKQVSPQKTSSAASTSPQTAKGQAASATSDDSLLLEGESLYRHATDRDPFSPLVRGSFGAGSQVKVKRGTTGLSRFTVEACSLEAIVKTPHGTVAWFQGPDGKPYKATAGEHFADGIVLDVSYKEGEVTIQQELNDPTAIKPFRNLVLKIRSQEGEGQ